MTTANGRQASGGGNGAAGSHRPRPGATPAGLDAIPHNLEAERGCVGSMLLDAKVIDDVMALVSPEDFFRAAHAAIVAEVFDLRGKGRAVDAVTVSDAMRASGTLSQAGGDDYLAELMASVPHAANAVHYADIVRQKAIARDLLAAAQSVVTDCASGRYAADDLLDRADRAIAEASRRRSDESIRRAGDAANEVLDRLTRRRGELEGLSTGIPSLDDATDGLKGGQLVVIAGRPSAGKSALGQHILTRNSIEGATPALLVSLEMGCHELVERLIVSRSGLDSHRLRAVDQAGGGPEARAIGEAYADLVNAPLFIDDTPGRTASAVASAARRYHARHGLGLLVVDYLQLVQEEPGRESRQEHVASVSRRLKALARELSIPVVALAQLNRQSELREDKRPRMADLRESGSIENDADVVILLHRPDYYDPDDQPGVAELNLVKNRNGPVKVVKAHFRRHLFRFSEADPALDPENNF